MNNALTPTKYTSVSGCFSQCTQSCNECTRCGEHLLVARGEGAACLLFHWFSHRVSLQTTIQEFFPGADNLDCPLPWTVRGQTRGLKEPGRREIHGGAAKPSLPHAVPVPFRLCRPGETITACYTTGRIGCCLTRTGVIHGRHLPVWLAPVQVIPAPVHVEQQQVHHGLWRSASVQSHLQCGRLKSHRENVEIHVPDCTSPGRLMAACSGTPSTPLARETP